GHQAMDPVWTYWGWEPQREAAREDGPAPAADHGHPGPACHAGSEHREGGGAAELPLHQGPGAGIPAGSGSGAFHADDRTTSAGGSCSSPGLPAPLRECSLQAHRGTGETGEAGTPPGSQAARGELLGHTVLPMESPRGPL
ncbi:unnamed protein product, partial [Symbiodinium sp. CCMP2456]